MKRSFLCVRLFCHRRAPCWHACLDALAIGLLLTGCLSPPAPPPDMNALQQLLDSHYYYPRTYVTQGTGGRPVCFWANGGGVPSEKVQDTWRKVQPYLEDFEHCSLQLWIGTRVAIVDVFAPSQATATVWWPYEDHVECREVRLAWDGSQWKVLSDTLSDRISCTPPIAP
jgi:hypothetical protein